jgi:hypothetical protein
MFQECDLRVSGVSDAIQSILVDERGFEPAASRCEDRQRIEWQAGSTKSLASKSDSCEGTRLSQSWALLAETNLKALVILLFTL